VRVDVFTLFPEAVERYCTTSVLGRAQQSGALSVRAHDLRDGAEDAHRTVDDSPFGGGAGMVLMPEPVFRAVEAVARLLPLVLGNEDSALHESFSEGLLEHPQYTRPAEFRGWEVPEVLRSGDHGAVAAWRRTEALLRTADRRPDLLEDLVRGSGLGDDDVRALAEHGYDVLSGIEPARPKDAPDAPH